MIWKILTRSRSGYYISVGLCIHYFQLNLLISVLIHLSTFSFWSDSSLLRQKAILHLFYTCEAAILFLPLGQLHNFTLTQHRQNVWDSPCLEVTVSSKQVFDVEHLLSRSTTFLTIKVYHITPSLVSSSTCLLKVASFLKHSLYLWVYPVLGLPCHFHLLGIVLMVVCTTNT